LPLTEFSELTGLAPSFLAVSVFIFGACIGSFLNVCVYRIPLEQSVVSPGSHCFGCSTPLAWYDNIPLLSYLILRGRCRVCGAQFSSRYFFIETLTGLLAVLVMYRFGLSIAGLGLFVFSATLVVITFIDLDHQIIPDVISLPGVIAGVAFSFVNPYVTWSSSLIGVALGAGILLALAMIGAFLGWQSVPFTLLFASFIGSAVGIGTMIRQHSDAKLALPFGPFLSFGALCYLFFGDPLINWYFGLLR
jgi:leader peptidase (prepilin peptidase)/N-methyltransferase